MSHAVTLCTNDSVTHIHGTPLRCTGEIPEGHDKLLFAWERGSKLFVTDAEPVRPNRAVFWKQFLKQQATMYKTPGGFEKKVETRP